MRGRSRRRLALNEGLIPPIIPLIPRMFTWRSSKPVLSRERKKRAQGMIHVARSHRVVQGEAAREILPVRLQDRAINRTFRATKRRSPDIDVEETVSVAVKIADRIGPIG